MSLFKAIVHLKINIFIPPDVITILYDKCPLLKNTKEDI